MLERSCNNLVMVRMQWTSRQVAEYLGVARDTVNTYRHRGYMPPPDGKLGTSYWWWSDTITAWATTRRAGTNRDRQQ